MPTYLKKIISIAVFLAIAIFAGSIGAIFSQNFGNTLFFLIFTFGVLFTWEDYDESLFWRHQGSKK